MTLSQEIEGNHMLQAAERVLNTPMHERGVAANGRPAIIESTAFRAAHRLSGKCRMQFCVLIGWRKAFATD